jgi:hypothetical protein
MPEKYVVPQFIDVEAKIIGPITARQFIIILSTLGAVFILYRLLETILFIPLGLIALVSGGVLAFMKVNGMPFHFFLLNVIQTLRRPNLRVWDKAKNDAELKSYLKKEAPEPEPIPPKKEPLTTSRLSELSLVVNTGGLYKPEDYQ